MEEFPREGKATELLFRVFVGKLNKDGGPWANMAEPRVGHVLCAPLFHPVREMIMHCFCAVCPVRGGWSCLCPSLTKALLFVIDLDFLLLVTWVTPRLPALYFTVVN